MPSILFKCPSGGVYAHAWIEADALAGDPNELIAIDCLACRGIHHFDPVKGTLLGGEAVRVTAERHAGPELAPSSVEIAPQPLETIYRNIALALAAIAIAVFGWIVVALFS